MATEGYYDFRIVTDVCLPAKSFEEAHKEAMRLGDVIWDGIEDQATVVVHEGYGVESEGVFCEGCEGCLFPGIRWPSSGPGGATDHEYVERCDRCGRYDSDKDARDRIIEEYSGTGEPITVGGTGHLWVKVGRL